VHKEMYANMKALWWFWLSKRTLLHNNQRTTIRDPIGEGPVYQRIPPECRKIFAMEKNLTAIICKITLEKRE
jgi:hypothetical protein